MKPDTSHTVRGPSFDPDARPWLAVDPVVLSVERNRLLVLLWRRSHEPHLGAWALPGVFVNRDEGLEHAVHRALRVKAHLPAVRYVEQLFTWDRPGRDQRGWVVVVAYFALMDAAALRGAVDEHDDVCLVELIVPPEEEPGRLTLRSADGSPIRPAFDHSQIVRAVVDRLRGKLTYTDLAVKLLPDEFTLRELQTIYEAILGRELNTDSFRRTVTQTSRLVVGTGKRQEAVGHRPAELYRAALPSQGLGYPSP